MHAHATCFAAMLGQNAEERFKREQELINEFSTLNQHTCYSEFRDNYHRQYFLAHRKKQIVNVVEYLPTTTKRVILNHRNILILSLNNYE